ncbi:MAG TPA: MFS transporter [Candidatus Limnocylindrales bacterium]|nr:MFS transporter [Candidatus Limnocylindrales bacterium]
MPTINRARVSAATWYGRWSPILPILVAEFVVWIGFGALLPIMPLYFRDHGVDFTTLGVIIAAWPAARLIGEPIFGWVADRTRRVPLMVAGAALAGIFEFLPLVFVGPLPFIVLRALAGFSTAMYDPAARGSITELTPPERRGEAFGLYSAAQMGGLLFGPAIGGLGAALFGGVAFVFVFGAVSSILAAIVVGLRVPETVGLAGGRAKPSFDAAEFPARPALVAADDDGSTPDAAAPPRLINRLLIAAIVINIGANFSAGTYDVIWSLYLESLGAGLELIGLTFAMFGLPILLFSPYLGRRADRGAIVWFVVLGGLAPAITGLLYTVMPDPRWAVPLILTEATGFAALTPALYAIVAAGSPPGRSSTAQGIFGGAGTIGFVASSLIAGYLASIDLRMPFWFFSAVMFACLGIGLLVAGRDLLRFRATAPEPEAEAATGA